MIQTNSIKCVVSLDMVTPKYGIELRAGTSFRFLQPFLTYRDYAQLAKYFKKRLHRQEL